MAEGNPSAKHGFRHQVTGCRISLFSHGGDARAVERVAHMLKGGSGSIGAKGMSGLCAQLEDAGASGELSRGYWLLERIKGELRRVGRALEIEVSGSR